MSTPAYFSVDDDGVTLMPSPAAVSGWSSDHVRGMAVTAALARAVESVADSSSDWLPVRSTFDLFTPTRMMASRLNARVIRRGRRLQLAEASLLQDGSPVARATVLHLRPGTKQGNIDGMHLSAGLAPPPLSMVPTPEERRLYFSTENGWTPDPGDHVVASHRGIWQLAVPVVRGERPTAFQNAASVADLANLTTNWGRDGLRHINADVTLSLARLPSLDTDGLGVVMIDRLENGPVTIGVCAVFDRCGRIGQAVVSTISNWRRAVDTIARLRGTQA